MEPTPEQKRAIERLYENESLTENLTDTDARALLEWAQQQITTNTDDKMVQAAVSAANESGQAGVQSLLLSADTFLAQELSARANDGVATMQTETLDTARRTPADSPTGKLGTLSVDSDTPPLGVSGQASKVSTLSAHAAAAISTPVPKPSAPSKKRRAKSKHKKK